MSDQTVQSGWVRAAGQRWHYRLALPEASGGLAAAASAPPVVFLSGLGIAAPFWDATQRRLAAHGYTSYAPDLPGFGASARWSARATPAELADATVTWLDALGLRRIALVGHSTGARVAMELAARRPERVERLLIASPTGAYARWRGPRYLLGLLADAPRERPALFARVVVWYLGANPVCMVRVGLADIAASVWDPARRLAPDLPLMVLCGTRDPLVPPGFIHALAASLPRARLTLVRGGTHAVFWSHPRVTTQALLHWLDKAKR